MSNLDGRATTKATDKRDENFRKLIDSIREKPICSDEGAVILELHPQSVRCYFQKLIEHHVLVCAGKVEGFRSKKRIWKLGDDESVNRFLVALAKRQVDLRREMSRDRPVKSPLARHMPRMVHQIKDDDEVPHKLKKGSHVHVRRDPLIEAFFGQAKGSSLL